MQADLQKALIFTAIYVAMFVPLEFLVPVRRKKVLREGIGTDVAHYFLTSSLTKAAQGLFVVGIAFGLNAAMRGLETAVPSFSYHGMQAAVRSQPIVLQILELLVLGDFFAYWAHRAQHEVKFLWRFHAVHHSPSEMDWLVTPRVHPLDQALKASARIIPAYLLGFSIPALGATFGAVGVLLAIWVFVVHSNVRLNLGPIEYLHITPRFHHWHHALDPVNRNYADQFPVWDLLFGTFHLPKDRWPDGYGTHAPVPLNWVMQLLHPFNPKAQFSYQVRPAPNPSVAAP